MTNRENVKRNVVIAGLFGAAIIGVGKEVLEKKVDGAYRKVIDLFEYNPRMRDVPGAKRIEARLLDSYLQRSSLDGSRKEYELRRIALRRFDELPY